MATTTATDGVPEVRTPEAESRPPVPIHETLGIGVVEMTPERVVLEMAVTPRVHQPMGLLHGGVSAVIAESAASMGAFLNCDRSAEYIVGTDLNISHLRARRSGKIIATATPVRVGRSLQVWDIQIRDEEGSPVAVSRCTIAVRPLKKTDSPAPGTTP